MAALQAQFYNIFFNVYRKHTSQYSTPFQFLKNSPHWTNTEPGATNNQLLTAFFFFNQQGALESSILLLRVNSTGTWGTQHRSSLTGSPGRRNVKLPFLFGPLNSAGDWEAWTNIFIVSPVTVIYWLMCGAGRRFSKYHQRHPRVWWLAGRL